MKTITIRAQAYTIIRVAVAILTFPLCGLAQSTSECEEEWKTIGSVQRKMFQAESYYIKSAFTTSVNNEQGQEVALEIWKYDSLYVLDNPYMKVWADSRFNAILMKEAETLLLRENEEVSPTQMIDLKPQELLDSSRTFLREMSCHCVALDCRIEATYDIKHPDNRSAISKVVMEYRKKSHELYELQTTSYKGTNKLFHTMRIEAYEMTPKGMELKGGVIPHISQNGKLKDEYSKYAFRDLR